jgi:hypothetical protein
MVPASLEDRPVAPGDPDDRAEILPEEGGDGAPAGEVDRVVRRKLAADQLLDPAGRIAWNMRRRL